MLPGTQQLLPIHDDNPTRTFPLVTIALIVINVLVFFTEPSLGIGNSCELGQYLYKWGTVPAEITNGEQIRGTICPDDPRVPGDQSRGFLPKSIWLSLLTAMFLHGGPVHLGGNMLFLWVFGNNIEDNIGKIRFTLFYLVTGFIASFAHIFGNTDSIIPTVGASGAIAGVLGAYVVLYPGARVTTIGPFFMRFQLPAAAVLGLWFISQFFIASGQRPTEGGGVAWLAHVGGFVAGVALIWIFGGRKRRRAVPVYYGDD